MPKSFRPELHSSSGPFYFLEIASCKAKMLRKDAFHGLPDNIILCVMEVHK